MYPRMHSDLDYHWIHGCLFVMDIKDSEILGKCKSQCMISICALCVISDSNSPHTVSLVHISPSVPPLQLSSSPLGRLLAFSLGFVLWNVHVYYRPHAVISLWLKCRLQRWAKLQWACHSPPPPVMLIPSKWGLRLTSKLVSGFKKLPVIDKYLKSKLIV